MSSKKNRINIRHPERALLTDTLPYELPLFYTNANLAILSFQERVGAKEHALHARYLLHSDQSKSATKPYSFEIRRGSSSTRRLDLAHPRSQHFISKFYADYEYFICNACSRSNYSLRYPSRVATHYIDPKYSSTDSHKDDAADEDPAGFRDQSKWASTYFSYRDYNLSHKFFESNEFLELEKKFSFLMKIDISRCFDSIYTHSIEWSMRGKEFSKDHLPGATRKTFESEFDAVIRHSNWNETHGIVVGPETSRIFAEIILQSVDRVIKEDLDSSHGQVEVRRYVDDYYLFSGNKQSLDDSKELIKKSLGALNLHLNEAKTEVFTRPFLSKITAARSKVSIALDAYSDVNWPLVGLPGSIPSARQIEQARTLLIASLRKTAIELDVPYEQFCSFALSILNRHLGSASEAAKQHKPDLSSGHLSRLSWLISVIRIGQFLFAIDQRVTTSIKLAKLYSTAISLAEELKCARGAIEGQILDGLRNIDTQQTRGSSDQIARINHICTVDMLMTGGRRIEITDLKQHIDYEDDPIKLQNVSIFQVLAMLFLSRRRHRFRDVRQLVKDEVERRISQQNIRFTQDTEAAILLTDYLACPYFDVIEKRALLKLAHKKILGTDCTNAGADKILNSCGWISFTDWQGHTNIQAMLARKELTPAYE